MISFWLFLLDLVLLKVTGQIVWQYIAFFHIAIFAIYLLLNKRDKE